jgi:hypothetical protein
MPRYLILAAMSLADNAVAQESRRVAGTAIRRNE